MDVILDVDAGVDALYMCFYRVRSYVGMRCYLVVMLS